MALKIYNTLTKQIDAFKPIKDGQVGMYVCGPTTYDHSHIGHARTYVFFDFFRRYLESKGIQVKLIMNLTDVDDKIIKKAKGGTFASWQMIPDRYGRSFFNSMTALRVKPPFTYTSVSAHMQEIIEMIQELTEKGHAYEANDGIYFDVQSFRDYGKLSGRVDENAQSQKENPNKRSEKDFALWKFRKTGEPFWYAPFGEGRPGWHIECSAMARKYLGKTFDIHGGGMDLIFPHHENELAQSEAVNDDAPVANYWVHSAFLTIDKDKMSKSVGNFVTISDMLTKYPPELIRYYLLSSHYRTALDFSWEKIDKAREQWTKLVRAWYLILQNLENEIYAREDAKHLFEAVEKELTDALDSDLQTPKAYAAIHKAEGYVARGGFDKVSLESAKQFFQKVDDIFAILPAPNWTKREQKLAKMMAELREYFRRKKDFKISDEVRDHLKKIDIEIDDGDEGSKIRFV